MKKLLFILLCLPLFLFSQEERQYESKMSFTQFKKELHEAVEQGIGYTLENCVIVNDRVDSIEFILSLLSQMMNV